MIFRSLLAAAALLFAVPSAHAAFDFGDLICESSTTTGTGTLNLAGALTNYVGFASQITSASVVPYHIIASDGKLEVGYGVYTDAGTDTLSRVANWSTDGSGAELTLPAGTHSVCVGPNTQMYNGFKGMQFYNDDAGAVGAVLPLWHDSASAADGDIAGEVQVWGGADDEEIGQIRMEVDDGATTSEDTQWQFVNRVAGSDLTALTLGTTTLPNAGTMGHRFDVGSNDNNPLLIESTSGGSAGPVWLSHHNSADPADEDQVGILRMMGETSTSAATTYGMMRTFIDDPTNGDVDSRMEFQVRTANASLDAFKLGLGASSSGSFLTTHQFNMGSAESPSVEIVGTAAGNGGPSLVLYQDSASPATGDNIGSIHFYGEDDGGGNDSYASIIGLPSVVTAAGEYGQMNFNLIAGGATVNFARGGNTGFYRWFEASTNGANYKGFTTAAANTATTTCTFEDDANFVPDSCVGDGSDASDGRIKTDLKPAGDVGTLLDSIKIYDYAWTVDAEEASEAIRKGKRGFGPVAQELFNVNADFVEVGGDDPIKDPWTWKPERVVPYLIVEVQNLRKRLANQACYGIKLGSACIGVSM
jgi:hypothetical protein